MPAFSSENEPISSKLQRKPPLIFALSRLFFFLIFLAGATFGAQYLFRQTALDRAASRNGILSAAPAVIAPAGARPINLTVPSIGLKVPVVPVGLLPDRSLQIPDSSSEAGWYVGSPAPGRTGTAILDGHLDTATGTALFWNLHKIKPGDKIEIGSNNGSTAVFTVQSLKYYPQNNFPAAAVYGQTGYPSLRLITCAGSWDEAAGHYTENLVIFAGIR